MYLGILLIFALSGCKSTYVPPNEEVCIWLPSARGFCRYTLDDRERIIESTEWLNIQTGRFSMSPEAFSKYQLFIETVCNYSKCTEEQKESLEKLKELMNVQIQ